MQHEPTAAQAQATPWDTAACGLLRTSADGLILAINRTFCLWLGREAAELAGRVRLHELLGSGARIFHYTHWMPLLQMQGSVSEVKLEVLHADGRALPMVMNAVRRPDPQAPGGVVHEVAAFIAHDRDRYERELLASRERMKALARQAERHQEAAQDRARVAEQMMGIVGHDLRNPLSTVSLGAHALAGGDLSPAQRQVVERIARAGERAARMATDLLDFTQARLGGGLVVRAAPLSLHEVVAGAVDELAQAFPRHTLRHERSGQGECAADADRLVQLVGNLVANATQYGAPGQPVTVASSIGGAGFSVSVHNHGAPIPPQLHATLFEPMQRGSHGASSSRSVGLGLYIVREIARAHAGRVSVQSDAQSGTCFVASFPRRAPAPAPG